MQEKLISRAMDAIIAEPWKTSAEIAKKVGAASALSVRVTFNTAGLSFDEFRRDRIKQLVAEHKEQQELQNDR